MRAGARVLVGAAVLALAGWAFLESLAPCAAAAAADDDEVDAARVECTRDDARAIASHFLAHRIESRCPDDALTHPLLHASSAGRPAVFMNVGANKGFAVLALLRHWARRWCDVHGVNAGSWSRFFKSDCGACDQCNDAVSAPYRAGSTMRRPPTIFAYEPGPNTVRALNKTLRRLPLKGIVHLQPFAFGNVSKPSTVAFPLCEGTDESCGIDAWHATQKSVSVPLTSVDLEIARLGLKKVDMLLVDTEGNDVAVLWGAREAFRKGIITLVEYEHHVMGLWSKHSHQSVIDMMDGFGFDCWWAGKKHLWRITGCWDPAYELRRWSNVICALRSHRWRWILETLSYDPATTRNG